MKRINCILSLLLVFALASCQSVQSNVSAETTELVTETETETVTEAEPEEPEVQTLNIIMAGDVLLHTRVSESGNFGGNYNFDHLFANCKDIIDGADLAIVNQEVILGGEELGISGYPAFNGPFEVADSLASAGFDVILHATNHALDRGRKGIESCLGYWNEFYPEIEVAGIYLSEEDAESICTVEAGGAKIAILNYTYGTNGIQLPADMPYCVGLLNASREDEIREDIREAKEIADIVVVAPHWGTEYTHIPTSEQEKWTQIFFEAGVDLVIGTHPHVVQPYEIVDDGEHRMAVYYSIGNYVNATEEWGSVTKRMLGALADVEFINDGGEWVLAEADVIPIVSHVETDSPGEVTVYTLDEYTEELASRNEIIYQDPEFSLEALYEIRDRVFESEEQ